MTTNPKPDLTMKEVTSNRKPYNNKAGYIASRRAAPNKGWVVIYDAAEAGLEASAGKYAVVCETHSAIVNTTSMPKARAILDAVDFCEQCQQIKAGRYSKPESLQHQVQQWKEIAADNEPDEYTPTPEEKERDSRKFRGWFYGTK